VIKDTGNLLRSLVRALQALLRNSPDWIPLDEAVRLAGSVSVLLEALLVGDVLARHKGAYINGQRVKESPDISSESWRSVRKIDPEANRVVFKTDLLGVIIDMTVIDVEVNAAQLRALCGKSSVRYFEMMILKRPPTPGESVKAWAERVCPDRVKSAQNFISTNMDLWRKAGGSQVKPRGRRGA
jgi:hypothetical protein